MGFNNVMATPRSLSSREVDQKVGIRSVACQPGVDGVLHVIGLGGVGGGKVAGVTGEGRVTDEGADAVTFGRVVGAGSVDAGVEGFDNGGEAVGLDVLARKSACFSKPVGSTYGRENCVDECIELGVGPDTAAYEYSRFVGHM